MKNVLIVIVVILLAVNIFGFLFGDDDRSSNRSRASEREGRATEQVEASGEVSFELGATIYSNTCAVCHGNEGQGGVGEELADNRDLADTSHVVKRIVKGQAPMPAFNSLSDEEVASVSSYIRNSWGNEFGEVSARDVAAER